ncbi:MAG: hypothetical protein M5R40_15610 [Anaerolineae bacterium]|nr:hypothetical protein [Anaerolineae bacterium]
MNSKERMARAMRHELPDRAPVMCQLALGHYFLNVDLPPHRIWFTSEGFAQALLDLRARYHFDGVLVNLPGRDPDWQRAVASINETAQGEVITWRNGDRTHLPYDDNPQHASAEAARARPSFEAFDPDADADHLGEWTAYIWGCIIHHTCRAWRPVRCANRPPTSTAPSTW